jgi:hypothetical protein
VHFLCFLIIRDLSARSDLLIPEREILILRDVFVCAATFAALSLCFFLIKKSKITFSWLPNANSNYSISCVPPLPFFLSPRSPLMQILNIYTPVFRALNYKKEKKRPENKVAIHLLGDSRALPPPPRPTLFHFAGAFSRKRETEKEPNGGV